MFDPNDKKYDAGEGTGDYTMLKTPGDYLLGTRAVLKHDKTPTNAKEYTRFAFVVIAGKHKDESFTDRVFRSQSSYKRLAQVCRAMRITEAWDPSKTKEVERVMLGRAFKSSVKVNEQGYAELKFPTTECTENELAIMREWEREFREEKQRKLKEFADGVPDLPDFGDDDDPGFEPDADIPF